MATIEQTLPLTETAPIYAQLGVAPFINASGHNTAQGTSIRRWRTRRWPDFGHAALRNDERRRVLMRTILAGQRASAQVTNARDTVYGSEGSGSESLLARPGQQCLPASVVACRQHAEFVALGIGKHGPRGVRLVLADVDPDCPLG